MAEMSIDTLPKEEHTAPLDAEPASAQAEPAGAQSETEPGGAAAGTLGPLGTVLNALGEAAGVAKGTFDFFFKSFSPAAAQDPAVKEAVREATKEIPNQDIIYEQLAHNLAYGKYDLAQLKSWGYGAPQVVVPLDELTGMFVVAVSPDPTLDEETIKEIHGGIAPRTVIAFRGSTDAIDWADDVSPEGVGAMHFAAHKAEIAAALARYAKNGPPDVTGHSLGGALAQMAATVGPVNRVVTFQAPGISPEMAALVPKDVQTTNHRAAGDPVAWAGAEHLEGDDYIYNQTTWGSGMNPHTAFLLDGLNAQRAEDGGVAVPNLYEGDFYSGVDYTMSGENHLDQGKVDEFEASGGKAPDLTWVSRDAQDMDRDGQTDGFEQAVDSGRATLSEGVRWLIGSTLGVGDDLGLDATRRFANAVNPVTSGGAAMTASGGDMQLYLEVWHEIEPQIGHVPNDELIAQIDEAPFEDPRWAEQMKSQVLLATAGGASYVPEESYLPGGPAPDAVEP